MNLKIAKIFILFFIFLAFKGMTQSAMLNGQSICSDGTNETTISITGMDPSKYYALYLDDKLLQLRKSEAIGGERNISFGSIDEPGIYSAAEFDKVVEGFPRKQGTPLKGVVTISRAPVVIAKDTMRISSGEKLNLIPRADMPETSFSWTSVVKSGKVKGNTRKGSGPIEDLLVNDGTVTACVVYSIIPFRASNGNVCTGKSRDQAVLISPPK
jgi:hypothetical protein